MRTIASNNYSTKARRLRGRLIPNKYAFPHYCTLEAMRTQGPFSFFQGATTRKLPALRVGLRIVVIAAKAASVIAPSP